MSVSNKKSGIHAGVTQAHKVYNEQNKETKMPHINLF